MPFDRPDDAERKQRAGRRMEAELAAAGSGRPRPGVEGADRPAGRFPSDEDEREDRHAPDRFHRDIGDELDLWI